MDCPMTVNTVTIPISQTKKQRLQELKKLAQSRRTELGLRPKQPDPRAPTLLHQPKSAWASAAASAAYGGISGTGRFLGSPPTSPSDIPTMRLLSGRASRNAVSGLN